MERAAPFTALTVQSLTQNAAHSLLTPVKSRGPMGGGKGRLPGCSLWHFSFVINHCKEIWGWCLVCNSTAWHWNVFPPYSFLPASILAPAFVRSFLRQFWASVLFPCSNSLFSSTAGAHVGALQGWGDINEDRQIKKDIVKWTLKPGGCFNWWKGVSYDIIIMWNYWFYTWGKIFNEVLSLSSHLWE